MLGELFMISSEEVVVEAEAGGRMDRENEGGQEVRVRYVLNLWHDREINKERKSTGFFESEALFGSTALSAT